MQAYTWFNTCPGSDSSAVDDEDPSNDPGLPPFTLPDQPTATGTPPISPTPTGNAGDGLPDGYLYVCLLRNYARSETDAENQ
jgi:hypothetical protein